MNRYSSRLVVAVSVAVCSLVSTAQAARWTVLAPYKGPKQIEDFRARGVEVITFTREGVYLLADDRQLDYLLSQRYPVSAERMDGPAAGAAALDADLGLYHTFAEMESTIGYWEATYPSILEVFVIGYTIEGRRIDALKISDNVTVDEDEPEVLYMGNLHARELMAVEMPLLFAEYLLTNYGSDATVTGYVNDREIFFIPMINADGHVYVENNHGGSPNGWWRLNRRYNISNGTYGVDLNRNFGYAWGYDDHGSSPVPGNIIYRGSAPFSEPETQAVRDFVESRNITMWLSYHSFGELLLYPWGYYLGDTPDHDVYSALGDSMSAANGYLAGNSKSGAIYITNGDSDDWGYGEQGTKNKIFAFTPEVNSNEEGGFGPPDTLIQPTFDLNLEMNMLVLKYAANPYQVVGPYRPAQYAVTEPYSNAVHRLSWSAADPADPNPIDHYEVEACETPGFTTDDGSMLSLWDNTGFTVATGHTGSGYYSGSGDSINRALTMLRPYVVDATSDTLSFWIDYDIESDYDYGYVEVSGDGGGAWTPVAGNITTNYDPHNVNLGNGITGSSGGWVFATFPLTDHLGEDLLVRIRYVTDQALTAPGMTVDDVGPVATCVDVSTVASSVTDTTLDVTPTSVATYRYRVRGIDAEDQPSRWSNVEDYTVATLTAADEPLRFRTQLGANYPNPFNPATRIPYVVGGRTGGGGTEQAVTLRVYDVGGALVATLVDGMQAAGPHRATWDGTDDAGRTVASGIYFARLVVGGSAAATRKLVLLK